MKKQNLLVLLIVLVLTAAVALLAAFLPEKRIIPVDASSLSTVQTPVPETAVPAASSVPSSESPAAEVLPAEAYLVVTVGGMIYEPLPLAGEGSFTISQDENTSNTIHVTPDSIWMEHSTCDNQDCVDQGTVSLNNIKTRVLSNMIICLPNEVVLELHTPETLKAAFDLQF